ncbi:MAG: hypothetical protein LBT84_03455, partial [Spirochaetia bacterium]|nr:hypothetical protein [Spirochaetia bacterium]
VYAGTNTSTDNYANSAMTPDGVGSFGTANAATGDGADVSMGTASGQANDSAWWSTPGWTIKAAGTGDDTDPWEWSTTLPKLYWE